MNNAYDAATKAYAELVERTYGNILVEMPFAYWLEKQKQSGMYWGA
jgi:hypothetical protein